MDHRAFNTDLAKEQQMLRTKLLTSFRSFDGTNHQLLVTHESTIVESLKKLTALATAHEGEFLKNYSLIVQALFHLITWSSKELNADGSSGNHLQAAKSHARLVSTDSFNYLPEVKDRLVMILNKIAQSKAIDEVAPLLKEFITIPVPRFFTFETSRFGFSARFDKPADGEKKVTPLIVLVEFNIDGEPWANPHILKPELYYNITGKIRLNYWPEEYDTVNFVAASTLPSDSFSVSISSVKYKKGVLQYSVTGTVLFKYAQSNFDDTISIAILAQVQNAKLPPMYPTIIGYRELIVKVVDPNSSVFVTGSSHMNKVLSDVATRLSNELPGLDKTDYHNFIKLLNGILSFQGYCAQVGTYKNVNSLTESEFRDNMIQYLHAKSSGEDIIVEASVAGGRIEITYKGIIAELKVEKVLSEREELIKKYGKQPIQYASGNGKQLSILCILDLTEKKLPPGPPQNNVRIVTPTLHGFEKTTAPYPARLVMAIIDGNTKDPSAYSK